MILPAFVSVPGAPFDVLPPGIHWASLDEIAARFAISPRRVWLFEGITQVVDALKAAGCKRVYLDGSYVTAKDEPNDFDGCWDPIGVDSAKLDPVLLDFSNGRVAQKAKFRGEMFIAGLGNRPGETFLEFFQTEKHTGQRKGLVGLHL